MKKHQIFLPSQAGFCRREEAVTQAACVLEILKQWKIAGDATFALFVDLKKRTTQYHTEHFCKIIPHWYIG